MSFSIQSYFKGGAVVALTAGAVHVFQISNPVSAIALAAIAHVAINRGLPYLTENCCRRKAPQPRPRQLFVERLPVQEPPQRGQRVLPNNPDNDSKSEDIQEALASCSTNAEKDALLQALALSLQPDNREDQKEANDSKQNPAQPIVSSFDEDLKLAIFLSQLPTNGLPPSEIEKQCPGVHVCALARVLGAKGENDSVESDEIIPTGMKLKLTDNVWCNVATWMLCKLSRDNLQGADALGYHLSNDQQTAIPVMMGLPADTLSVIWETARVGIAYSLADQEADNNKRRDLRASLFKRALLNQTGTSEQLEDRRRFIEFYRTHHRDWWDTPTTPIYGRECETRFREFLARA